MKPRNTWQSRDGRQAMTLLEITVVMMIISIMLVMAIPKFGPMRAKSQLRMTARELATLIRFARAAAIYEHRAVKLRLDVDNRRYRLDLMRDSVPASRRDEGEVSDVEALHSLPEKVYFDRVILYGETEKTREGVVVLDFGSRGNVTAATIVLADVKGRRMTVDVFGTTGAVEVYEGSPPEPGSQKERPT